MFNPLCSQTDPHTTHAWHCLHRGHRTATAITAPVPTKAHPAARLPVPAVPLVAPGPRKAPRAGHGARHAYFGLR